jgi:thioredoxin-related protein
MATMKVFLIIVFAAVVSLPAKDLKWHSFNEGYWLVKSKGKPAVIDFYTDWCKWCKVMDEKTFNEKRVKKVLSTQYVTIKINPEKSKEVIYYDDKEYKPMELTQALGIRAFPAVAFMDKEGKFITMLPGFVPAETFYQVLTYIKDECYKKQMSFEDYQKKKGKCK